MINVSLDSYRTKGVKVFSGYDRGKVVAKEIKRIHGEEINIIIPNDVHVVTNSFRRGFNSILNGTFELIK